PTLAERTATLGLAHDRGANGDFGAGTRSRSERRLWGRHTFAERTATLGLAHVRGANGDYAITASTNALAAHLAAR
ncbi:MAG: hypothetical protein ACR2NU_02970, partial [Aeoliella sp.]